MPKKKAKEYSAKEKKKYFISLYLEGGAVEEKIPACEKRAKLEPGAGKKILALKTVRAEVEARMLPVKQQHMRQSVIGEAVDLAALKYKEVLSAQIRQLKEMKIEKEVLEGLLLEGALILNWNQFPKEKLDVIKAAAVWNGTFESGNTRRLAPAETGPMESNGGLYTSLFQRLGKGSSTTESSPESNLSPPSDGVFDLIPPPPKPVIPPEPPPSDPNVITVEVG